MFARKKLYNFLRFSRGIKTSNDNIKFSVLKLPSSYNIKEFREKIRELNTSGNKIKEIKTYYIKSRRNEPEKIEYTNYNELADTGLSLIHI